MTVEAFTPAPPLTVAGIGPYAVPHPYTSGSLSVVMEDDGLRTTLDAGDWSVTPAESATAGSVYLDPAAAAVWAGATLYVVRQTQAEQGWQGVQGERERGLEVQLDRLAMLAQEAQAGLAAALRVATGTPVIVPGLDRTIIWNGTGFEAGPSAGEIEAAEDWATLARRWATEAQGVEVTPGAFSAFHWAQIALAAALAGGPPLTRQIATDNVAGTDGGGDLSANRTIRLFGQALRLHQLAVNGFITRVDATTLAGRSIDGTANQISVANPAGAAGNPTMSLVFPSQATAEAGTDAVSPMNALRTKQAMDARRGFSASVLTTSGTSFLVSSIPAGIRELYVHFSGVGTDVTESLLVQLGTSAGLVTTGYDSGGSVGSGGASSSVGFLIRRGTNGSFRGTMMLRRAGNSNSWFASYAGFVSGDVGSLGGGFVPLPGAIDRLALGRSGFGNFITGSFYLEWVL